MHVLVVLLFHNIRNVFFLCVDVAAAETAAAKASWLFSNVPIAKLGLTTTYHSRQAVSTMLRFILLQQLLMPAPHNTKLLSVVEEGMSLRPMY